MGFVCLTGLFGVASLACSFGEEFDFRPEDGTSASVGEGLSLGLETGGGDLVKKLNRELCLAICYVAFSTLAKKNWKKILFAVFTFLLSPSTTLAGLLLRGALRGKTEHGWSVGGENTRYPIRSEYKGVTWACLSALYACVT